jgi:hypothetical protein
MIFGKPAFVSARRVNPSLDRLTDIENGFRIRVAL